MASALSKSLPTVSKRTGSVAGARQRNQIEAPSARPACAGSPASRVAPRVEPSAVPNRPEIASAAAKASLSGGAFVHDSDTAPVARTSPSTAMRYVVPTVAANVTDGERPPRSSLRRTTCSASIVAPVYTPSSAGKPLPLVSNRYVALVGAVQEYQMLARAA